MAITIGLVAHVDAGKTTLSESMLYLSGTLRNQGRVDHKDTFLDYDKQERERGITIFSKISTINLTNKNIHFIDTPGHVDFSGEMERSLSILDYAILIISGTDGVQSHTKTIWKLLDYYKIPVFIFVNKMDITHYTREELFNNLKQLSNRMIDMEHIDYEDLATNNEELLNEYLETETVSNTTLSYSIKNRDIYPVYFGSALKNENIQEFLNQIDLYTLDNQKKDELEGIVYKINNEKERLTYLKLNGGTLHVKDIINGEKINQIRIYQGNKYELVEEAHQDDIVILTGLKNLQAGDTIGHTIKKQNYLQPYMHYQLHLPDENKTEMLENMKKLSEEEPLLNLKIKDADHIEVSLMGEIQIEILKELIKERYHCDVLIDDQDINYLETITEPVEGVGHFEPLRHYAEVHLLLEPLPEGSGLVFRNKCQNNLPEHYQRLIMTHLQEKRHIGVLTGSYITDMRITLLGGRAHEKHTEGGDFREATYRAIRQGLMNTESKLLEPYAHYEISIPSSYISKIYFDFDNYEAPVIKDDNGTTAILTGSAPLSFLSPYSIQLLDYTKGNGQLTLTDTFYSDVINEEEVIERIDYNPLTDLDNQVGSIFCTHGAGFYVDYDEVEDYMHLDYFTKEKVSIPTHSSNNYHISDEVVKRVYESIYGKQERRLNKETYGTEKVKANQAIVKPECLLVDGYNVIFSWDELNDLAKTNLAAARDKLIDTLVSYQGYRKCLLILVFDAYKVPGNIGSKENYHNIHIVYTKEAQTADAYIEKATKEMAKDYRIVVATSDNLEQKIVIGHGATRISSRELYEEIQNTHKVEREEFERNNPKMFNTPLEDLKS